MERSGAASGWSQYQYEQGSGYPSQLGSSHQSFLTSTGCRSVTGPVGAYGGVIPSSHPQSGCHFDTIPNNKNVHNSLSPRFSASVQHRTEIFARDEVQAPLIPSRRFFSWYPSSQSSSSSWYCDVCSEQFHQSHALRVHFHQFHLNPHHLSPEDSRFFRLSNFLVKLNEDIEIKTEYPGLYRCHECFNVFNKSCSLRTHLLKHLEDLSPDSKTMVVAKMAPKIDKLSREDFEDVSPREKRPKNLKPKLKVAAKISKKPTAKVKLNGLNTAIRQRRKSRKSKQSELQSEPSDEFNSDSDLDKDKDYYSNFKQKNRKPLVTRQKLALGLERGDANRANGLEPSLSSSKESENGSHKSDQLVNGHVLESIDNVLSHVKNEFMIPEDEINLIKTMDENKSPGLDEGPSELSSVRSRTKARKKMSKEQKQRLKSVALKQLKRMKKKVPVGDLDEIKTSARKISKKRRTKNLKNGFINGVKSKNRSPVKDKTSPKKMEVSSNIKDSEADISINNTIKKRPKSDKLWRLKIRDHSKASNLVQQLVQPASDFICLKCSKGFQSFGDLRLHKLQCKGTKNYQMCTDSKNLNNIKTEIVDDNSQELFEYVTGSVTDIPETSFNNMHGKISDLNTEDAQKLSSNPLNEIGLVKLNYSGSWSVKDVWESGGWEPRDDQLTWQQYELSSAISKQFKTDEVSSRSGPGVTSESEDINKVIENFSENEIKEDAISNKSQTSPSVTDLAHSLTRKLTTQIVSRKAPLITCSSMDRRLVTKLAKLPWSEQRKVKEKFDAALVSKRTKRVSVSGEPLGQNIGHCSGIRQSGVTNRLDLKQVGRSVKYMKVGEREAQAKERDDRKLFTVVEGKINGEWEIEHSFLCSVCGIEYDDVLEILHHKWESHPHCLVTHVSLKEGVVRPPALLYPQVGPSTIHLDPTATPPSTPPPLSCSKCSEQFSQTSEEGQGQFHSHLLTCGGVKEQEGGKRRKRKRRGHGGGLKSTVRMLQKGNPTGNSRDGTDTEEATPRKRVQTTKKIIKSVPLIPTHSRTTRFKETKKKEARKMAARERRNKAKVDRPIRSLKEVKEGKKGVKKQELGLEKDKSDRIIVEEVLEKVISTVEKVRGRPGRPKHMTRKPRNTVKGSKGNQRERRLSVVRARQMDLYREQSSESESDSERSESEEVKAEQTEHKINNERGRQNKKELKNERKSSAKAKRPTPVMQTPTRPVLIRIENDDDLEFLTDLDRVAPYVESPVRGMSPSKTPVRGLSPLKALISGSAFPGSSLSPIRLSKDNSRSSSFSSVIDLLNDSDSNEELHEPSALGKTENKEVFSPKSASRSLKRLETNLVSKLLLPASVEDDSKRRSNFQVTYRSKFQPSRFVFPIELKISAIARVESGETQVAVARDLNINTATLAAWWLRRSEIKGKFEREVMQENGDDMKSQFAISNLIKKFKNEAKGLSSKERDINPTHNQENHNEKKPESPRKSFENRIGLPLHVKANALKQVIGGKTQAAIAKELGVNPSTVAHWWAKKDIILRKYETDNHSNLIIQSDTETTSENTPNNKTQLADDDLFSVQRNEPNTSLNGDSEIIEQKRRKSFDGRKISTEVRLGALQRLDAGESKASIARDLGVGITTLGLWSRKRSSKQKLRFDTEKSMTKKKIREVSRQDMKHVYSLEMKVKVIGRIDSGEDIATVAESANVNVNTAAAWWNRREKILRKSKISKLSSSKVSTSLDESTVKITHDDEINGSTNSSPQHEAGNLEKPEVYTKCLEIAPAVKPEVKDSNEEKHQRGRRHNISHNCQPSPVPNGRLYMPLEVKQSAIRRIEEGATQVVVARDLDMSLSTVASWWRKKDILLQNLTSAEDKKLAESKEKDPKTTVLDELPKDSIQEDVVATLSHREEIISSRDIAPSEALQQIIPTETKDKTNENISKDTNEIIEQVEAEPVNITEDRRDISEYKSDTENSQAINLLTLDVKSPSNNLNNLITSNSVGQSGLLSSMKSAFNGIESDVVETNVESDVEETYAESDVVKTQKESDVVETNAESDVVKTQTESDDVETTVESDVEETYAENSEISEAKIISSTPKIPNSNISNVQEFSISEVKISNSPSKGDDVNRKGNMENISNSTNGMYENEQPVLILKEANGSELVNANSSISTNETKPKSLNEPCLCESDLDVKETQNRKDLIFIEEMNYEKSLNGIVKPSQPQDIDDMKHSIENPIQEKREAVTVEDRLDVPIAAHINDISVSRTSTPSPDNLSPSLLQNDIKAGKVVKKKSLDFLANTLMKKALARSQTQLTSLPPEPSQSSSSSSNHCQIVQASHVLSQTSQVQVSPPTPPSLPVPQSGLGLIVSSYCSSEDEL